MSEKTFKAVIYCRLSKEDGDKIESNSISGQKAFCEDFIAKQNDIKIVRNPIVDDGISGVSFERSGFRELEEEIRKGRVDCVIVRDLSRFSRNYIEGGRYLERVFPSLGVRFIAINDHYDSLNSNKDSDAFMLPFKNLINEAYCKDISVKIRSSLSTKRKNGDFVGNYCPYGYKKSSENLNKLVVDEDVRENIILIFSLFKDGVSISKIADRLNEMGISSPMEYKQATSNFDSSFKMNESALWGYNSIKRILTNEIYIGVLAQGKRTTPNYKVKVVQKQDENNWIRVENAHEPIVSYEDFSIVGEMLKRDVRSIVSNDEENTLSGFLFCGDCGATMIRKAINVKNKRYVYYICSHNKKTKECSSHSISAIDVENKILNSIRQQIEIVLNIKNIEHLLNNENGNYFKSLNFENKILTVKEEIEKCKKLKIRLYEDYTEEIINKNDYLDFRESYTKKIEAKENILKKLEKEETQLHLENAKSKGLLLLFKEYENINQLNRRILMALVDRVKIHEKHNVEIVFRYQNEYLSFLNSCDEFNFNAEPRKEIRCLRG